MFEGKLHILQRKQYAKSTFTFSTKHKQSHFKWTCTAVRKHTQRMRFWIITLSKCTCNVSDNRLHRCKLDFHITMWMCYFLSFTSRFVHFETCIVSEKSPNCSLSLSFEITVFNQRRNRREWKALQWPHEFEMFSKCLQFEEYSQRNETITKTDSSSTNVVFIKISFFFQNR